MDRSKIAVHTYGVEYEFVLMLVLLRAHPDFGGRNAGSPEG